MRANSDKPTAELSAILLDAVQAFARGAPQEDDMTVVLVKREAQSGEHRTFPRSFDALPAIHGFTADFLARHGVDAGILATVDFAIEELFTNMVKYSPEGSAGVRIDIRAIAGGVEVTLTDYDVEQFDVTRVPDAATDLPIEQREPGGIGLASDPAAGGLVGIRLFEGDPAKPDHLPQDCGGTRAVPRKRRTKRERMLAIDFGTGGVVVISGRLDAAQAQAAQTFLDACQGTVTLDCGSLEYISSAGLGVLLKTQKRLLALGREVEAHGRKPPPCRTSSGIRASTRSSKSRPRGSPCANF